MSPSSQRSTAESDTPSSRESRVLPQVDRLEKFRKRVKISAFSCSRRSLALVLNFYLVAEAQIKKPVKRMAVIHIVSLSELRIEDTAPKLSYRKIKLSSVTKNAQKYRRFGRQNKKYLRFAERSRSREGRSRGRGILNARHYLLELERNLWSRGETDCGLTNRPT